MLSKEAQKVIEMFMSFRKHPRPQSAEPKDPKLAQLERIYGERAMVDDPKRAAPLPDKLSLQPELADGVYGEWLRYLDADPEKLPEKVILFLHGGGFQTGSALSRRSLAAKICKYAKVDTFSINYRLCPEYKFPAHLDDCVTAYLWLLKRGYAPENITIFGESAGANLCLCICHYLRDHHFPLPGGVCAFSPVVELVNIYDSHITNLPTDAMLGRDVTPEEIARLLDELHSGKAAPAHNLYVTPEESNSPYASPIRGDFHGFPRLMLQVGGVELLYDDAVAVYEKAKAEGVDVTLHVWEGLFHVFAIFDMPETEQVCAEIGKFCRGE